MKLITQLNLVLLLTFMVAPANAYTTGDKLLTYCEVPKSDEFLYFQNHAYCSAYIAGAVDGMFYIDTQQLFCVPQKVTNSQLIKIFVNYLNANPERLHEFYVGLVLSAMREAFPCKSDFNN